MTDDTESVPCWTAIRVAIADATGRDPGVLRATRTAGGCIHESWRVRGEASGNWFVKTNRFEWLRMFRCEATALESLRATGCVRVPVPIGCGVAGDRAYLLLEWLDLRPLSADDARRRLGVALARLHSVVSADGRFGWPEDNFIGATPQPNSQSASWTEFFRDRRLGHQFALAAEAGRPFSRGGEVLDAIPSLLRGHDPPPSLLHGDLWSGNAAADADGLPVLFDPASHHGDPETDLAFTRLFGGFGDAFHEAYHSVRPRVSGWERRTTLYNLYHVLNHAHLFGGGYRAQAERMIDELLGSA